MRRVLLLGGLDPCGGAGITADATVVAVHGAQPLPIAIVLTAQNRHGFQTLDPVPVATWQRALRAALADGEVHALKVGLLGSTETIAAVAEALAALRGRVPIVVDPVLSATAGGFPAPAALAEGYCAQLLPLASVLTPNHPEALLLYGARPEVALATGCGFVLEKGGHGDGAFVEDRLHGPRGETRFRRPRLAVGPVHGTGCAFASALATRLAQGCDVASACALAGDWLFGLLQALGPAPAGGLPRALPLAISPPASPSTSTR
ncbi:MAG TPA: hydroxymethylpyrimidine/phosphomethylpyrimidine kinase [Planctomycetota bacterium]|nr:hydroxymethylpyrimidine/phosphomethylpyrimidine kinase [Planctomycetota bacterium]